MAAREIYARAACQLRTHDRAVRAESLCPGAMGLYLWMLLQARGEQTNGRVLEASALAAWGAPISYRRKQIEALIAVDLIERVEDAALHVVKYEEHNDTPADIAAAKAATRTRVRAHRQANDVTRYRRVTAPSCNGDVPISSSLSGSDLDLESRSEDPPQSPREAEPRPEFSPGTAGAVEARAAFAAGVQAATGKPFVLGPAPFHDRDLCATLNGHAPPDLATKLDVLRWLPTVLAVWIRAASPTTITPGKLLDWLNADRPESSVVRSRGRGGGPKGDRQGLDGWVPPTGTDFFGGDQ